MHRYSSGDWYTLVTAEGLAMLPDSVTPEFVERVWHALSQGKGLAAVLEGIVGSFGTSLSSLPPFAVASRTSAGDGVQVAVRGPIEVVVKALGTDTTVTGLGVTTWSERSIDAVDAVEAALPGAAVVVLPINDGVVLANRVRFTFREAHAKEPDAQNEHHEEAHLEEVTGAPSPAAIQDSAPHLANFYVPSEPEAVGAEHEDLLSGAAKPEESVAPATGLSPQEPDDPQVMPDPFPAQAAFGAPSGETTIAPLARDLLGSVEEEIDDDYDQLLYGDTVRSSVEDAAVRVTEDDPHSEPDAGARPIISGLPSFAPQHEAPAPSELGDHDGETISIAKLRAMQAQEPASTSSAGFATAAAPSSPITLVVSTGERVTLDRGAVVGRRPRLARVQGGKVPQLVTVPSPNQDVSRSHVELRVEGAHLLAVDLDTTNGTKLLRLGQDPVRLQPGDSTMLVAGDRLDLGDGILLHFEGLR